MKKKLIAISLLTAAILLLTGFSPALASPNNKPLEIKNTLIPIEINYLLGRQHKKTQTLVSENDAEEIRQYLIKLHNALEQNDQQEIIHYETLLKEKGLFTDCNQRVFPNNQGLTLLQKKTQPTVFTTPAGDNISNNLCYFNAIGEGLVAWWLAIQFWEAIVRMINNQSSVIAALILLLIFLPYFVLTMLITNLIPFRILAPAGVLSLKNGTVSAFGLNGVQRMTIGPEPYAVNLSGFTGITINIPPINNRSSFLFVSGIALKAEGKFT
jgi:hypothetical protein